MADRGRTPTGSWPSPHSLVRSRTTRFWRVLGWRCRPARRSADRERRDQRPQEGSRHQLPRAPSPPAVCRHRGCSRRPRTCSTSVVTPRPPRSPARPEHRLAAGTPTATAACRPRARPRARGPVPGRPSPTSRSPRSPPPRVRGRQSGICRPPSVDVRAPRHLPGGAMTVLGIGRLLVTGQPTGQLDASRPAGTRSAICNNSPRAPGCGPGQLADLAVGDPPRRERRADLGQPSQSPADLQPPQPCTLPRPAPTPPSAHRSGIRPGPSPRSSRGRAPVNQPAQSLGPRRSRPPPPRHAGPPRGWITAPLQRSAASLSAELALATASDVTSDDVGAEDVATDMAVSPMGRDTRGIRMFREDRLSRRRASPRPAYSPGLTLPPMGELNHASADARRAVQRILGGSTVRDPVPSDMEERAGWAHDDMGRSGRSLRPVHRPLDRWR